MLFIGNSDVLIGKTEFKLGGLSECLAVAAAASDKPMWQVVTVPAKLGDAFGSLIRYAQESIHIFFCPT